LGFSLEGNHSKSLLEAICEFLMVNVESLMVNSVAADNGEF
jgi:hypothetical protein